MTTTNFCSEVEKNFSTVLFEIFSAEIHFCCDMLARDPAHITKSDLVWWSNRKQDLLASRQELGAITHVFIRSDGIQILHLPGIKLSELSRTLIEYAKDQCIAIVTSRANSCA
jgi:hypothetical protein